MLQLKKATEDVDVVSIVR